MRGKVETNVGSDQQRVGIGAGNANRGGNAAKREKEGDETAMGGEVRRKDKGERDTRFKRMARNRAKEIQMLTYKVMVKN